MLNVLKTWWDVPVILVAPAAALLYLMWLAGDNALFIALCAVGGGVWALFATVWFCCSVAREIYRDQFR